jgi:hypothetical protein
VNAKMAQDEETENQSVGTSAENRPLLQVRRQQKTNTNAPNLWRFNSGARPIKILCLVILMVSIEFEETVQAVPTLRLYESAICQRHFGRPVPESQCKIDSVQRKLAWIRGWQGLFDAVPSMS